MLWSAALFFYVYYTPAQPDCQRLPPLRRFQKLQNLQTLQKLQFLQKVTPPPGRKGCISLEFV